MKNLPTIDEQVSLCEIQLRKRIMKRFLRIHAYRTLNFFFTDEALFIAINRILKEPLSETELQIFNKNVLKKNRI